LRLLSPRLADACDLADDPLVAPARVLAGKTKHQCTNLLRDRGPTRCLSGVRPAFPHKLAMPAKQRVWTNEERRPARPAQQPAGGSQEHPVALVQPRASDLAAKNRELVAQDHDLELLELTRAQPQCRNRQRTSKKQVQQRYDQAAALPRPESKEADSTIANPTPPHRLERQNELRTPRAPRAPFAVSLRWRGGRRGWSSPSSPLGFRLSCSSGCGGRRPSSASTSARSPPPRSTPS
jgi:hypothetical protein